MSIVFACNFFIKPSTDRHNVFPTMLVVQRIDTGFPSYPVIVVLKSTSFLFLISSLQYSHIAIAFFEFLEFFRLRVFAVWAMESNGSHSRSQNECYFFAASDIDIP